ncbi:MAG TPA: GNAT family N-acetyltransferase, partial [Steroidobacteraceae bacterium]|nr:GNAT family N-acetyltransferase [Steroidobacteraceae bacterium]
MTVTIRDASRAAGDHDWIQQAYRGYLDDLTLLTRNTGMFPVAGEFGDREPDLLSRWFADDSSHPLVILHDGRPVGFALVSRPPPRQRDQIDFRLAEFYVVAAARRRGIGRDAAILIFNRFAGRWEVNEFMSNRPALAFWRRVIAAYTEGDFTETMRDGEVQHLFATPGFRTRRP